MSSDGDRDDITRAFIHLGKDTLIGHYQIIEKIGAGGMGEVYLAEDTELNRQVALKFLPPHLCQDADCRARFKREAQAAAKLNHPNIITIHDVSEYSGRPYFVMEHIDGLTLDEYMREKKPTLDEMIGLAIQVCEGLNKAHQSGIIHRDIKPSNILVDHDGRPKILDFGLAAIKGDKKITKTGSTVGTISYMSPEQTRGEELDNRSDIFSLGNVLYEMVTGQLPFKGDHDAAILYSIAYENPEPMARYKADVPDGLQNVVDRALEKDPAVRYQSAADLMADLRRLRRRTSESTQRRFAPLVSHWYRRVRIHLVLPILSAILFGAALLWTYHSGLWGGHARANHLAVIPFANLAGQSTNQAFCDGLVETLASKLTQLGESEKSLLVVPASEVRENDVRSAGQARRVFGVNLAVTGSVQQLGDKIRTTLNLVDATTERQIHSRIIDERKDNISSLQDSTVAEVARMLNMQLLPESRGVLKAGETESSNAYRAYLEGRGHLKRYDESSDSAKMFPYIAVRVQSLDSAQRSFDLAIKQDSSYALAYAGLGEVFFRRFNMTNDADLVAPAIRYSSRALELNDRLAPALLTLGILHRETGQNQKAVSYLTRALQIDSINNDAYVQLAHAYEGLKRVAEAESTYQRCIMLEPDNWQSYYNLALFYAVRGQKAEALGQAKTAESLAPAATSPLESLGSLYILLGENDKARMLLERSLAIQPNYVAYNNLGAIFQMEKQYGKAVEMYERGIAIYDNDFRVWSNLGWMYKRYMNEQAKATNAYNRAIALAEKNREVYPNDAELISNLADCYWQIGNRAKSLALAKRAIELAPKDLEVMVRVGIIYETAGRREEALRLVEESVQQGFPMDRIRGTAELQGLISDPRFDSIPSKAR